jgi:ribosomal protein S18 acetylase RimI-like enzyme
MASYKLRQATKADFDFLYTLHRSVMREYIEPIWGWHEDWQAEYFYRKFDPAQRQIIRVNDTDAGVLVVEERQGELYLSLIELLPPFQNKGIGTAIISDLIDRANHQRMPLSLHVLKTNLPARKLYEKLGFVLTAEEEFRTKLTIYPKPS